MKRIIHFILVGLFTLIAVGCAEENNNSEADTSEIKGPAFVLFYTEN